MKIDVVVTLEIDDIAANDALLYCAAEVSDALDTKELDYISLQTLYHSDMKENQGKEKKNDKS